MDLGAFMNEAIEMAREEGLKAELDRLHLEEQRIKKAIYNVEMELSYIKFGTKYPIGSTVEHCGHKYRVTGYSRHYVVGKMIKEDGTDGTVEKDLWSLE